MATPNQHEDRRRRLMDIQKDWGITDAEIGWLLDRSVSTVMAWKKPATTSSHRTPRYSQLNLLKRRLNMGDLRDKS